MSAKDNSVWRVNVSRVQMLNHVKMEALRLMELHVKRGNVSVNRVKADVLVMKNDV